MESVDDLTQDTNKYFNYQRQAAKQELNKKQYLQKRVSGLAGTQQEAILAETGKPLAKSVAR